MEYQVKTDVFCLREGEWQVRIADVVLPTIWNSKGAALAGLNTEIRKQTAITQFYTDRANSGQAALSR